MGCLRLCEESPRHDGVSATLVEAQRHVDHRIQGVFVADVLAANRTLLNQRMPVRIYELSAYGGQPILPNS
jgi:hypothetical protein